MSDHRLRTAERAARDDPSAEARLQREQERATGQVRDPRHNPKPGDRVKGLGSGSIREIVTPETPVHLRVSQTGQVLYCTGGLAPRRSYKRDWGAHLKRHGRIFVHWQCVGSRSGCCLLESWRKWARGGEVLRRGAIDL